MSPLYERLGGALAINAAVQIFYHKVLADDRLKQYFDGVDMKAQEEHQKRFLTIVFGGPRDNITGKYMREAHKHLKGLNDIHVDAFIELLEETLKELGASNEDVAEATAIANSARDDVLNR